MLFLDQCDTLLPIIHLVKAVIRLLQIAITIALVVLLIMDFGKAVMAGKEDEIKSAQKLAIKRVVYFLIVWLVPWLVNVAIGLLDNAGGTGTDPSGEARSAWSCWANN